MRFCYYKLLLLVAVGFGYCQSALGQSAFQNLDFEQANIPAGTQPGTYVPTSSALPGWNVGGIIYYDNGSLGGALLSINDANTPYFSFTPLQGNYSVLIFAGPDGPSGITQTGLVPAGSKSILMDIQSPTVESFSGPIVVTLGGQPINMVPVQTFANYVVYGGDVSAYAGLSENLTIEQTHLPGPPPSGMALDDIIFSPSAVPEPATWALFLGGVGTLAFWRKHRA